jgi:hypothetical protein
MSCHTSIVGPGGFSALVRPAQHRESERTRHQERVGRPPGHLTVNLWAEYHFARCVKAGGQPPKVASAVPGVAW